MSLRGYDALKIEIRPWLLADRIAAGLAVGCALVIEAVAARYPEPQAGLGVAALVLLAAWTWHGRRRARGLAGLSIDADGHWHTLYSDGRVVPSRVLPGTRLLGSTVALRWQAAGEVRSAWLTPWDVPAGQLRELTVRISTTRDRAGV
jgi:hypothetical protein